MIDSRWEPMTGRANLIYLNQSRVVNEVVEDIFKYTNTLGEHAQTHLGNMRKHT